MPEEHGEESDLAIGSNSNPIFESYEEDLDVNDYLEAEYHSALLAEPGQMDQTGSNYQDGDFEDEINNLQMELDKQKRLRDEEEAYLSALANPTQAHLHEAAEALNMEVVQGEPEIHQLEDVQGEAEIPQPIELEGQQNLRRSARISVRGVTKRYSNIKLRVKRTTKEGNVTMNPEQQAELLLTLRKEALAPTPLQQHMADQVDQYCGLKDVALGFITNVASGLGLGGASASVVNEGGI